jgi:hypothetical protein
MEKINQKSDMVVCPDGQIYWKLKPQITTMLCPVVGVSAIAYYGETLEVHPAQLFFSVNSYKLCMN